MNDNPFRHSNANNQSLKLRLSGINLLDDNDPDFVAFAKKRDTIMSNLSCLINIKFGSDPGIED